MSKQQPAQARVARAGHVNIAGWWAVVRHHDHPGGHETAIVAVYPGKGQAQRMLGVQATGGRVSEGAVRYTLAEISSAAVARWIAHVPRGVVVIEGSK